MHDRGGFSTAVCATRQRTNVPTIGPDPVAEQRCRPPPGPYHRQPRAHSPCRPCPGGSAPGSGPARQPTVPYGGPRRGKSGVASDPLPMKSSASWRSLAPGPRRSALKSEIEPADTEGASSKGTGRAYSTQGSMISVHGMRPAEQGQRRWGCQHSFALRGTRRAVRPPVLGRGRGPLRIPGPGLPARRPCLPRSLRAPPLRAAH